MSLPYHKMSEDQKLAWGMVCSLIRKRYKSPTRNYVAMAAAARFGQGKPLTEDVKAASNKLSNSLILEIELKVREFIALAEKTFEVQLYREPTRPVFLPMVDPNLSATVLLIESALQHQGLPVPKYTPFTRGTVIVRMPSGLQGRKAFTVTLSVPE